MDITKVPFNQLLGISLSDHPDCLLQLDDKKEYTNHLETVHAAALFALAEGSGAQLLLKSFPEEIIENVIPVLRKVDVSYKKPAKGVIRSKAILQYKTLEEILAELQSKKRTLITTTVELYDTQNAKVFMANFEWFVVIKEN